VKNLLFSTIVTISLVSLVSQAIAAPAGPSANATRYGFAVVDVSYIFKQYKQFSDSMEGLKKEMQAAEGKLKGERDAVQSKEEMRKQYNVGSAEFKQLDEEIARLKAEFNLSAGRIRKEFLERESKVYYQTYLQVSNAVQHYAQQHNIGLVLRFNGDQIDPNRREDVLRAINKPVVSQNNIDITPDILALLNRGGAAPAGAAPTASKSKPVRRK